MSGPSAVQPQHVGTRLYLRQGSTANTFNIGVSKNSSNSIDIKFDTTDFLLAAPILIVGSYQINGTTLATDDLSTLYINPASSTFGAATAPTSSTPASPIVVAPLAGTDLPGSNGQTALAGFVLRQDSAIVPNVQVDELRIDSTSAQVTPPVGITWNVNADGNWSDDAKWSTAARPDNASAFVNFTSIANQARTINVDGAYALRTINFTGGGPYLLNGSGSLNFSASAAINVMNGNPTVSAPINLAGDLLVSAASGTTLTAGGAIASNGYSLSKAGAGTLVLANARFNQLNVIGGKVKILPNQTTAAVSRVSVLNISTSTDAGVTTYNAAVDLTNNDMVIDYAPGQSPLGTWNGSDYTGILGAIRSGRNGGAWNGAGIITSQTAAASTSHLTTLGVAEASSVLGLTGSATALCAARPSTPPPSSSNTPTPATPTSTAKSTPTTTSPSTPTTTSPPPSSATTTATSTTTAKSTATIISSSIPTMSPNPASPRPPHSAMRIHRISPPSLNPPPTLCSWRPAPRSSVDDE